MLLELLLEPAANDAASDAAFVFPICITRFEPVIMINALQLFFQSVDFASEHGRKRYVYTGFADFCFLKRGHFGKEHLAFCFDLGSTKHRSGATYINI